MRTETPFADPPTDLGIRQFKTAAHWDGQLFFFVAATLTRIRSVSIISS